MKRIAAAVVVTSAFALAACGGTGTTATPAARVASAPAS